MAPGTANEGRPVDTRLAVVNAADGAATGRFDFAQRLRQRVRVRDLEANVVIAALPGLDQDQLVVALVAGQVGSPTPALALDQPQHIGLKLDRGVQVLDPQPHVSDARDSVHRLTILKATRWDDACLNGRCGGDPRSMADAPEPDAGTGRVIEAIGGG